MGSLLECFPSYISEAMVDSPLSRSSFWKDGLSSLAELVLECIVPETSTSRDISPGGSALAPAIPE